MSIEDVTETKSEFQWFVNPSTTRLELGGDYWVEVKEQLTVKESAEVQASLIKTVEASGRVEPNFDQLWKARIVAYIVDWNLSHNGKRIPFSRAAVDNMSKPAWDRLEQVVQAHIEAMETKHAGKLIGSMSTPASASAD